MDDKSGVYAKASFFFKQGNPAFPTEPASTAILLDCNYFSFHCTAVSTIHISADFCSYEISKQSQ